MGAYICEVMVVFEKKLFRCTFANSSLSTVQIIALELLVHRECIMRLGDPLSSGTIDILVSGEIGVRRNQQYTTNGRLAGVRALLKIQIISPSELNILV